MAKTKAEVRNRALVILGKLARGQTAEAGLAADMDDAYDQVYDALKKQNMVSWSSTDSIPNEFVQDVALLMAMSRAESAPNERYQRVMLMAQGAYSRIAANINGEYESPFTNEDF